ncbi:LOW QUALITY PROTEIN: hypothetical protein JCM19045_2674 [Bacillus sp. JCM 19045]|nr:LOW QUALITY PROTEIN: hypothetical protein JCM19045_2674 [Bacillus sp. JCM 19045]
MEKDNNKSRTTVRIQGQVIKLAKKNRAMKKWLSILIKRWMNKKRIPYLDTTKLSVLTALNLADEYLKMKREREGE